MAEKIAGKVLETVATMINGRTKDVQINYGDLCLLAIIDTLKSFTDEGLIDVDTYFKMINGLEYEIELSKYLGRAKGLKIKFKR